jgi:PKD repeat protein
LVSAGSSLDLDAVVITGNEGITSGGGITADQASVTVLNSTIAFNTGGMATGGIHSSGGSLIVDRSTVAFNTSDFVGGINISGTALIVNSTVSGNIVTGFVGGGIASFSSDLVEIKNSTIAGNTAVTEGGGLWRGAAGPIEITNSIIGGNEAAVGPDCFGTIVSLDYNLLTDTTGCVITGTASSDLTGVDPLLGPLQDNGGPTWTHGLLQGSPAFDAANPATPGSGGNACEATDQRGVTRPVGARCDIGAFEKESVDPVAVLNGPYDGVQGTSVLFSSSGSFDGDGTVVSFEWSFGDGGTSSAPSPLHSYVSPGVYSVTLTVTDNDGVTDTAATTATIVRWDAFVDDDGNIFETDIEWLAAKAITQGCNPPVNDKFCPSDFVTRGQMAAFLVRALGYTDSGGGNLFVDDDGHTFENDIDKLGTAGVTKGCNPPVNDRFCPDDRVTRGAMAAFLVRALDYVDNGGGNLFVDDDGSTFENDIDRLATAGVTKGCNPPVNDKFCPDDFVTRGQMAAFLHRALG